MASRVGNTVYASNGSKYRLTQEIGSGAEGSVWTLDGETNLVAKLYQRELPSHQIQKLEAMCQLKSERFLSIAAWPLALLRETSLGKPRGLLMRKITNCSSVHQLYGLKSRLKTFPEAQFPFLIYVATNIARSFAVVHEAGQVIGDVNHSNLLVAQNATVVLIDCDSFQFAQGNAVFTCPVGVPEFTPPELQGLSFASQRRTPEHDAFGLSVLIFYLLFLGRHPFMGSFDPQRNEIRMLDEAIREYRFPFALPDNSPEARLPGYVPRLGDFPQIVGDLFKRSFTRGAATLGRPCAKEWVAALTTLSNSLTRCSANGNHHYFTGAKQCPWCRAEGAVGFAIYGFKVTVVHDPTFNIVTVWAEIETIKPTADALVRPSTQDLVNQLLPDPVISQVVRERRRFRVISLAIVLGASALAVLFLQQIFAILAIMAALAIARHLWGKGSALAKAFRDEFKDATSEQQKAGAAFEALSKLSPAFSTEKQKLVDAKTEYHNLDAMKAQRRGALERDKRQRQLQLFLERFRLEDEQLPMIGDKTKMMLYNAGILDAADVEKWKVDAIKGFGPKRTNSVMKWRDERERQFQFDPSKPVDSRDLIALDKEFVSAI